MRLRAIFAAAWRFRADPHLFGYAVGKALLDPAYPAAARAFRESRLPLLDLGCGAGHLAAYLRACGYAAPIVGVDLDSAKIAAARRFVGGPHTKFEPGDAANPPPHFGHVCALDVFHYIPSGVQTDFLMAIASRLAPGGKALIRLTLRDESWRFRCSQLEEKAIHVCRWIPWQGKHFPPREALTAAASHTGLPWALEPMWGMTPFNSYMLTLHKPPP